MSRWNEIETDEQFKLAGGTVTWGSGENPQSRRLMIDHQAICDRYACIDNEFFSYHTISLSITYEYDFKIGFKTRKEKKRKSQEGTMIRPGQV